MALPELSALGIAVHAVTAEPGGEEVTARLCERDTKLDFKVHSDPDFMLLSQSDEEFYVKEVQKASAFGGTYTDYLMVQPALVVIDKAGAFQQVWSWMTPPLKDVEPKAAMTAVPSLDGVRMVKVRPDSADLALSIKEGRNVRLLTV
jgi:peroxiredoxin